MWHESISSVVLIDLQRQILLTCLRIHVQVENLVLEELRLPWSSKPLYPGETMTISDDYLGWFEVLLAQHPWDANIILQHLDKLRPPSLYREDHRVISRMIDSIFGSCSSAGSQLFARMLLLGTLFEATFSRIWSDFRQSFAKTGMSRIWTTPEIEKLKADIGTVLQKHSNDSEIRETRPYKRLQLLTFDHETLRVTSVEAAKKNFHKALSRLDSIEVFAMNSEVHDHHLALELLYRYYIFTPERDLRSVLLEKIAQFTAHFGDMPESRSMRMAIAYGKRLVPHGRVQKGFISQVLHMRYVGMQSQFLRLGQAFCLHPHGLPDQSVFPIGHCLVLQQRSVRTLDYIAESQSTT